MQIEFEDWEAHTLRQLLETEIRRCTGRANALRAELHDTSANDLAASDHDRRKEQMRTLLAKLKNP